MALILLVSKHLQVIWTREGIDAMRHHNSVLHGILKQIPWSVFGRLVDEHGADARVRKLSTKTQLVALLYGQLSGAVSLREIGPAGFWAMMVFLGILVVGFAYEWKKGALDWE